MVHHHSRQSLTIIWGDWLRQFWLLATFFVRFMCKKNSCFMDFHLALRMAVMNFIFFWVLVVTLFRRQETYPEPFITRTSSALFFTTLRVKCRNSNDSYFQFGVKVGWDPHRSCGRRKEQKRRSNGATNGTGYFFQKIRTFSSKRLKDF